jgi:hypothetical protein
MAWFPRIFRPLSQTLCETVELKKKSSMAWSLPVRSPSINSLFLDTSATLLDVLENPGLSQAIRNPSCACMDFFVRPSILNELFDWSSARKPNGTNKVIRQVIVVLSPSSRIFQKRFCEQDLFLDKLNSFPDTEWSSDPKICGNFQAIVDGVARYDGLLFTSRLSNLYRFLLHHMSCLALRDLFVSLAVAVDGFLRIDTFS